MSSLSHGTLNSRVWWLRPSALLLVLLAWVPLSAQGADLPATLRASMLVRVLAYDRRMGQHPPPLILAVAHRQGDEASESQGREFSSALELAARGRFVSGRPLRVVRIGFSDSGQLQTELSEMRAVALYVCEGLQVTRRLSILSIAGSEQQITDGLAIGLERKGNSPVILIHLSAARAEGADLDAGLLSLSHLIEPGREEP